MGAFATAARACPETNRDVPIRSCGPLAAWNRCFGMVLRPLLSTPLLAPPASETSVPILSCESGWPSSERAAQRSSGKACRINWFDCQASPTLDKPWYCQICSLISLPLIRARETLRLGETPNSSTPRHAKTVFQRLRWKQQYNHGQQQRERPDPRLGLRVHDQALVHGDKTPPAVAAAPGLPLTHRTSRRRPRDTF